MEVKFVWRHWWLCEQLEDAGKVRSLKNDASSREPENLSSSMRTRLANDGLSSKDFFAFVSCLNILLPLPNMSFRKIYFWQDSVNARSARDKFLSFASADRSFASCSTMETNRSSERRESGGFSMLAKQRVKELIAPVFLKSINWLHIFTVSECYHPSTFKILFKT